MSDVANEGAEPALGVRGLHDFRAFYKGFLPRLVAFLMIQSGDFAESVDVAHSTLNRLAKMWPGIQYPRSWARRTAAREIVRRITDKDDEDDVLRESDILVRSSADVEGWKSKHPVLRIIDSLGYRERQVLAWTLEGYHVTEIAVELQMEPDAVATCLQKVHRAFGEPLRKPEEDS